MTSEYECEVRFFIDDIDEYRKRLVSLESKKILDYEFTDHFYQPCTGNWNPSKKLIRIREWEKHPEREGLAEVLFTETDVKDIDGLKFKRSKFPEGKVQLYTGSLEDCANLLTDLGYVHWLDLVKKDCQFFELPKYGFASVIENVKGLGWTGELEEAGYNPAIAAKNIREHLSILGISESQTSWKPLVLIYAEKKGLM